MSTFRITPTGATLFHNGVCEVVGNDHPNYSKIVDALKADKFAEAISLMNVRESVKQFISAKGSEFRLENDLVTNGDYIFSRTVSNKALNMIAEGQKPEPLFNFLRKVLQNPLASAQTELLLFCDAAGFMIHEDGDLLAYKSVRHNYNDIHSNRVNYAVGKIVEMPRTAVDADRDRTCSTGLHFASHKYASTWAGSDNRLMLVKINPADVVAIPSDYSNEKGRAWRLEVIAEIGSREKVPHKEVITAEAIKTAKTAPDFEVAIAEYDAGFRQGIEDFKTGTSRVANKDASEAWLRGYDAAQKHMEVLAKDNEEQDEQDFEDGYARGAKDANEGRPGNPVGSESYKEGYTEGYNETLDSKRI